VNKISFLICSKNDNFEGKPIERLIKVLELSSAKMPKDSCEFLIADWGSDVPIFDELKVKINHPITIYYIPKEITSLFNTPISEVHCLNFLAKNANYDYVGRIDQDTVVGKRFVDWFSGVELNNIALYWSNRRDMPPGKITEDDTICDLQNEHVCNRKGLLYAVGIMMLSKQLWCHIRGYCEENIYRNHMEHEFILRLQQHGPTINIGCALSCPFYHIFHTRDEGIKRKNNKDLLTYDWSKSNDQNWGLELFKEKIIKKVII
jgi:hypothetical protein